MALVQARTLVSPSASALLAALSRQPKHTHPLFYALTATLPTDVLPTAIERLRGLSSSTSLGCLSAPLVSEGKEQFAASVAWFDGTRCVPFRSTIPGRERAQVGRRVDARLPEDAAAFDAEVGLGRVAQGDGSAWADVWAGTPSGLPAELVHIPCVSMSAVETCSPLIIDETCRCVQSARTIRRCTAGAHERFTSCVSDSQ